MGRVPQWRVGDSPPTPVPEGVRIVQDAPVVWPGAGEPPRTGRVSRCPPRSSRVGQGAGMELRMYLKILRRWRLLVKGRE